MKHVISLSLLLLCALILVGWFWNHARGINPLPSGDSTPTIADNVASALKREKQMLQEIERGKDEWRTPIEFYGKVVDEGGQPVSEARVEFSCNDLSATGTSGYRTVSDTNGLFSLKGVKGKLLVVKVSKDGFYTSKRDNDSFYYTGQNVNFVPDVRNPIIFHLTKKGTAEPLMVLNKNYQISVSGKLLEVDLKNGKVMPPGQGNIVMEFVKESPKDAKSHRYDWRFKVTIPNGGLIKSTNEFDFAAPQSGYEPSDLIEMPSSLGETWQSRMERTYFAKLRDGNYARITLDLMSHNGSLKIQSFLNPTSSRNLEFDPNKIIPTDN